LGRISEDSSAALKVQALVKKLLEEKLPYLESMKRKINEMKSFLSDGMFLMNYYFGLSKVFFSCENRPCL
jgi:hypothetical protein